MNRKDPRNFGVATHEAMPEREPAAVGRWSQPMPERVILGILRTECERLAQPENEDQLRRFFGHFFDPMIGEEEREQYVRNFQRHPLTPVLGYPRTSATFPCLSLIMERDVETDAAMNNLIGQTIPGEVIGAASRYNGSMYEKTYGLFIYATHPDVCLYMYHLAKMILVGSHETLAEYGIIDPSFEGTEMLPEENLLPENMFVRRLGVTCKSMETVPDILSPDPERVRVTGIYANDTVVSGQRGGVDPCPPEEET